MAQTAVHFVVTEETIASWTRRVDEGGERALVQTEEPVNKFPDLVAYIVRSLKVMSPSLDKGPRKNNFPFWTALAAPGCVAPPRRI